MDLLYRHGDEVEAAAFRHAVEQLDPEVDLVTFDTNTASFAIDLEDEDLVQQSGHAKDAGAVTTGDESPAGAPLRRRGRSKDGTWRVQVKVALAVTREGIPIRSWVLPGNTSDMTLVKLVRQDLKGLKLGRVLFVADSGFNSAENRREQGRAWGTYVLACRMGSVDEIQQKVMTRPGRYAEVSGNLRVKEVIVEQGSRRTRTILCHNPAEARHQKHHREQALAELSEKLAEHPQRAATAKWAIELRASQRYGRYLKVDAHGQLVLDPVAIQAASKHDGKWVVETNDEAFTAIDTAEAYKSLLVIERCFRSLEQAQIQLAPFHHRLPHRLVAHVKLCVLALLLARVAERITAQPWGEILSVLETLQVTEYETPAHRFFRCNRASPELPALLESFGISRPKPVLAVIRRTPDA
jgi:transposase